MNHLQSDIFFIYHKPNEQNKQLLGPARTFQNKIIFLSLNVQIWTNVIKGFYRLSRMSSSPHLLPPNEGNPLYGTSVLVRGHKPPPMLPF